MEKNAWIPPQLLTASRAAPDGPEWLHEIKFDGFRLGARRADGGSRLYTRNGHDWTERLPEIVRALETLPPCYLDAELVATDTAGVPTFEALQRELRHRPGRRPLYLQVFDLPELDGASMADHPLTERKARLSELLAGAPSAVRYVGHVQGDGPVVFERADALGLEGLVSKRAGSRYRSGERSRDWLKTKCWRILRFPVVGYTVASGRLKSLLLAANDPDGRAYAGRVELGLWRFPGLLDVLSASRTDRPPFDRRVRGARWIRDGVVAEVRSLPWADGRRVRHAVLEKLLPAA